MNTSTYNMSFEQPYKNTTYIASNVNNTSTIDTLIEKERDGQLIERLEK
jgi:hypothetical protein